jgi:hypothetical protein
MRVMRFKAVFLIGWQNFGSRSCIVGVTGGSGDRDTEGFSVSYMSYLHPADIP